MLIEGHALDPDYVPDRELIVHRGSELEDLKYSLVHSDSENRFITVSGPRGTGKTMIARRIISGPVVRRRRVAYVDCWRRHGPYDVVWSLADQLTDKIVHENSTARHRLEELLEQEPDYRRIAIFDEADMLADPDVLATVHDAPALDFVFITNDTADLYDALDDDLADRVRDGTHLECLSYSVRELTAILRKRANHGLWDDAIDDRQLENIAEIANGDARVAILFLRYAAEHARAADSDPSECKITNKHLRLALPETRVNLHQRGAGQLTRHQETVRDLMATHQPVQPRILYEEYCEVVDEPRSYRQFRTYLSKMEQYDLITAEGETSNRRYRLKEYSETIPNVLKPQLRNTPQ